MLLGAAALSAQTTVVHTRALVDGKSGVIQDAGIVIDGDRIVRVLRPGEPDPPGSTSIDLRRYTVIPGLIDLHTHMTYYWDRTPGSRPFGQTRPRDQTIVLAQENLRKTLETGVTTVRDLGASQYIDIALRDSVNKGAYQGPRMFVAGFGLSKASRPRGPGDTIVNARRIFDVSDIPIAVKQQVDAGADYIKMYGSTGTGADTSGRETFTYEEMKAAVDAAHSFGKRIAIHSYGAAGGRDAVRAGTTTLEHAVDLDDSTLAVMARQGIIYVPTIDHNRYYAEYRDEYGYTAAQAAGLDSFRVRNLETARRAYKAGVRMGMGSDAVFTMFGQNTRELGWFAQIGMTPAEVLATATTAGAMALGMENRLGAIAPGYYADMVAIEGDPTTDVSAIISGVKWVMKGGKVVVDKRR